MQLSDLGIRRRGNVSSWSSSTSRPRETKRCGLCIQEHNSCFLCHLISFIEKQLKIAVITNVLVLPSPTHMTKRSWEAWFAWLWCNMKAEPCRWTQAVPALSQVLITNPCGLVNKRPLMGYWEWRSWQNMGNWTFQTCCFFAHWFFGYDTSAAEKC